MPLRPKIVPELGAPYDGNWGDWPSFEYYPLYAMGLLARGIGIFAALNITLLVCHLLAGATFYLVSRHRGVNIVWAFTAALAFGLASYIFSQSPDHPTVALCWHIPLFLLVWDWVASESGVELWSKRFWVGMVVGLLAGVQNTYYAAIFCQLVLLGGIAMFARTRRFSRLISAVCFVAATVSGFVLMNIDTWIYRLRLGPNSVAVAREFQWLEIYGLKLIDFFVPPAAHRWELFRNFAHWRAQVEMMHDEGSYFGIIGTAALSILVATAVLKVVKRDSLGVPAAAWQVLWIFVFFTTSGLNAIVGAFGFTYLRASCRYSIVILAISLLFAAESLTRRIGRRALWSVAAGLCCLIIFLDQVPSPASPEGQATIARQVSSDQKFVADMESILPKGAMVFQFPVMDFPEAPLRDVSGYDHLRPYLFSHQLRFSFGSMKGRPREQWQHDLTTLSMPDAIAELKKRGFSAVYLNRNAYPNRARDIEENLRALGYNRIIENTEGDLFCVPFDSAIF